MQKKKTEIKKEFGVIGYPLVHSYSPQLFNEKFAQKNLPYQYLRLEIDKVEKILDIIEEHPLLQGFNVTIPYKQAIMPLLDEIDPKAQEIGAVNVVKIDRSSGKPYLKGYNSDWYGFTTSIKEVLQPHQKKALILGTGGASNAVQFALSQLGIESLKVSRKKKDDFLTYAELTEEIFQEYSIIINTTPVGTSPKTNECPAIPYEYITNQHLAFDLIYNPIRTLFLQQAEVKGATIQNGWKMLVYQALRSYEIWEGVHWTHEF